MIKNEPDVEGERGVLVATTSIVATEGQIGTSFYAASKVGVYATILPLAREFSRFGVRVMAIAHGIFETPMFSRGDGPMVSWLRERVQFPTRTGKIDAIAHLIAYRRRTERQVERVLETTFDGPPATFGC